LDLLAQSNLKLDLILPSELKAYTFQVEQVGASGDLVRAVLKIDNRILRLFAPKLRLVYDAKTKKLLEYQGISNIPDAKGKRQDVSITYAYEEHGQSYPENTPVES
ncbi:hypothetical protein JXA88_14290, partial [Candidatus Fermentibacteria bacterium]|nr:hypothetical protein [Candidatus Fermentibacteria bacterium]